MIVLDASAIVEWLLRRPAAPAVDDLLADGAPVIHGPAHLPVEVASALRGLALGGHLTDERGRQALSDLEATDLTLHEAGPLLARAWELRSNVSTYDACYVALAEILGAELVTMDGRLATAHGIRATVRVIAAPSLR